MDKLTDEQEILLKAMEPWISVHPQVKGDLWQAFASLIDKGMVDRVCDMKYTISEKGRTCLRKLGKGRK